jgi:hypothetical protein
VFSFQQLFLVFFANTNIIFVVCRIPPGVHVPQVGSHWLSTSFSTRRILGSCIFSVVHTEVTWVQWGQQPPSKPNVWWYNWAILFLGEINTGTWLSKLREPEILDNKIWSWVPWDLDPRKIIILCAFPYTLYNSYIFFDATHHTISQLLRQRSPKRWLESESGLIARDHFIYTPILYTPWRESASELYRPSGRCLWAKLVSTFAGRGCRVVSMTDPYDCILGSLDWSSYFFFQATPQLYSRDWVDPVPDPLHLIKSGGARNRTRASGSVATISDH